MHNITMDIKEFDSQEEAEKQGYKIPLTPKEANYLSGKNRAQRRQWAKEQRKLGKKKW
jgi:hypothetical protein